MESLSNVDTHPYISICSGIGGLDLGVTRGSGGSAFPVCYVERELTPSALLAQRMATKELHEAPIWSDIKTFDAKPFNGKICGISGGYPCQPFSLASPVHALRKGIKDERNLWYDIERIIRESQPRWCFFENVDGHLSMGYFDQVKPGLEALGFRIKEQVIEAASIGATHRRKRLFILAYSDCYPLAVMGKEEVQDNLNKCTSYQRSNSFVEKCGCLDGRRCETNEQTKFSVTSQDSLFKQSREGLGEFPPPRDGEWQNIPVKYWPSYEREFHRVADGIPRRLDIPWRERIKLLGLAVVPSQAQMAWYLLWKEVKDELGLKE